jgi:hypothetical protein
LHGFLNLNDRAILSHAGKMSHELALQKAENEYDVFNQKRIAKNDGIDSCFEQAIKNLPSTQKKKI